MERYSAQRVRAKARAAVKRREDAVESEEMEAGELNLIPYLDIVTNLMLFLLFSVSAGIVLTQIDTTLPAQKKQDPSNKPPETPPDEQPLKLFVSITRDNMVLWSVSGLEGTLREPKPGYVYPRTGRPNDRCEGPHNCETNQCDIEPNSGGIGKCVASDQEPTPVYDYRKLNDTLYTIAKTRYGNRPRKPDTYQIMLQADPQIPYSTIVAVMAAMRCKLPPEGKEGTMCALPNASEDLKKAANPMSADGKYYDTTRAVYDPDKMGLFPEIGFSTGFE